MRISFFRNAAPRPPESGMVHLNGQDIAYTIIRSARRRRTISLSIKPGVGLRVLAPLRVSRRDVANLLSRRAGWIGETLHAFQKRAAEKTREYENGAVFSLLGETYPLALSPAGRAGCVLENGQFTVQGDARMALAAYYKKEAETYLKQRLDFWAGRMGVSYTRFQLGHARHVWGSCTARNAIRINWRIMMAGAEVIDYLLVHELCHIPHKNHGPRFWKRVASLLPDYRQRQQVLRANESRWLSSLR